MEPWHHSCSWGSRESNPAGLGRRVYSAPRLRTGLEPRNEKSHRGFPGWLPSSVWFTSYWKGALRPGFSTRSWAGRVWLGFEHTPRPTANSAYESLDHACSALANLVACAVSFVDRIGISFAFCECILYGLTVACQGRSVRRANRRKVPSRRDSRISLRKTRPLLLDRHRDTGWVCASTSTGAASSSGPGCPTGHSG